MSEPLPEPEIVPGTSRPIPVDPNPGTEPILDPPPAPESPTPLQEQP